MSSHAVRWYNKQLQTWDVDVYGEADAKEEPVTTTQVRKPDSRLVGVTLTCRCNYLENRNILLAESLQSPFKAVNFQCIHTRLQEAEEMAGILVHLSGPAAGGFPSRANWVYHTWQGC